MSVLSTASEVLRDLREVCARIVTERVEDESSFIVAEFGRLAVAVDIHRDESGAAVATVAVGDSRSPEPNAIAHVGPDARAGEIAVALLMSRPVASC